MPLIPHGWIQRWCYSEKIFILYLKMFLGLKNREVMKAIVKKKKIILQSFHILGGQSLFVADYTFKVPGSPYL